MKYTVSEFSNCFNDLKVHVHGRSAWGVEATVGARPPPPPEKISARGMFFFFLGGAAIFSMLVAVFLLVVFSPCGGASFTSYVFWGLAKTSAGAHLYVCVTYYDQQNCRPTKQIQIQLSLAPCHFHWSLLWGNREEQTMI